MGYTIMVCRPPDPHTFPHRVVAESHTVRNSDMLAELVKNIVEAGLDEGWWLEIHPGGL